jgi:hypothetical protein
MNKQKQPENWRRMLADLGGYENGLINIPASGVIPIIDEVEKLRAKLDQATVALKDISNDNWPDAGINAGEYANLVLHELAAGARPVEPAPAGEYPAGAIVNGRAHIERLESTYQFECEAGPLSNCKDWQGLKRCFEYLIGRIDADRAMRAAQPAPGAGDQVQMILKHRLIRKVEGDWLAASEFMTGEPDPSWLAKTEESPEEWRIEQARRVSGEQIQAGLTRAFASWKKPAPAAVVGPTNKVRWILMAQYGLNMAVGQDMDNLLNFGRDVWNAALSTIQPAPAAQDDAKDAARLYPVVIDGLLWLCTKHGGTFKPVDDCAAVNPPLSWKNALAADKKEPTNGND